MACIAYIQKEFEGGTLEVIEQANDIIEFYEAQGFVLTIRQLYYQFVARGLLENKEQNYKRIIRIVSEARLAGFIDWNAIEDRTRSLRALPWWESAASIIDASARGFRHDLWADQEYRVEVWIEKDALVGVIEGVCHELHVPYFSCRGYTSQSEMHAAAMRLQDYRDTHGQEPVILHLGDHDPSGIDMSRDIIERMELFIGGVELRRLALNMDQIRRLNPPPNPAKESDSRSGGYKKRFGSQSWELDALDPRAIATLIRNEVMAIRDQEKWDESVLEQEIERGQLRQASKRWTEVVDFLDGLPPEKEPNENFHHEDDEFDDEDDAL